MDTFEYIPYDTINGLEYPATTVTINVVLPTAVDDAFHDNTLRSINGNVLGNDTGGGMQGVAAALVTGVSHGSLVLDSNGSLEYTPTAGYYGNDYFTYRATAGTFESNVATVTLTMDVPIVEAADDNYMSIAGQTVEENVLGNDTNADTAEYALNSGPSAGSLSFSADGSFAYVPPQGYDGLVSFQYTAIHSASGAQDGPATVTIDVHSGALTLDEAPGSGNVADLQQAQLLVLYDAAVDRWRRAGVSDAAIDARLGDVRLAIADLPGAFLGAAASSGVIYVDKNGAGHGWFVDATPGEDNEFEQPTFGSERRAIGGSAAYGYVDLLTVLEHEIGHLLGLDHSHEPGNIMLDSLSLGTRRVPTALNAAAVDFLFAAWQAERERLGRGG